MRKKFYPVLLILLLAITACTNEIGLLPDNEPTKLIINALLSADGNQNRIYLHRSGWMEATEVTDGTVRLYTNGRLVETITPRPTEGEEEGEVYYQVHSTFQTGDKVRIEASAGNGTYQAEAETIIEAPIQILKVDTANVRIYSDFGGYSNKLRFKIELQTPQGGEKRYYRLFAECVHTALCTNTETQQDTIAIFNNGTFYGSKDVALTDGQPTQDTSDSGVEIFPPFINYFGVFNNAYFKDNRYTMTIYMSYPWTYLPGPYSIKNESSAFHLHFFSISEQEYHYLRALGLYAEADTSSPLENAVILPSNIKNGIGFFAIENRISQTIEMKWATTEK